MQLFAQKLADFENSSYLCSVKGTYLGWEPRLVRQARPLKRSSFLKFTNIVLKSVLVDDGVRFVWATVLHFAHSKYSSYSNFSIKVGKVSTLFDGIEFVVTRGFTD